MNGIKRYANENLIPSILNQSEQIGNRYFKVFLAVVPICRINLPTISLSIVESNQNVSMLNHDWLKY